jgi:small subunit ribosomal protein S7
MPRRRVVAKRVILPDPKYNDRVLAKFMNAVMLDGKKSVAESIVYGAFDLIAGRTTEEPLDILAVQ